jgi:site-specific DNA-cytosine methylase
MMTAYYNEIDPFCCDVLSRQIKKGNLPRGIVDERDIKEVQSTELVRYRQYHLFAGIGGIPLGLRWAGISDNFPILTGGFPCQDISAAGKGEGIEGERSGLWFEMFRIIREISPTWLLIENVPALRTRGADIVLSNLEEAGYATAPLVVGAWTVGAGHRRDRIWIVAHSERDGWRERGREPRDEEGKRTGRGEFEGSNKLANPEIKGRRRSDKSVSVSPQLSCSADDRTVVGDLADTTSERLEIGGSIGKNDEEECTASFRGRAYRFPARPGEQQHEWERSRLVAYSSGLKIELSGHSGQSAARNSRHSESSVGISVDGLSRWLATRGRKRNREALKALGNSVVPAVVAEIGRVILKIHKEP